MRCVKASSGEFAFQISLVEKQLLFDLLKLYPLTPGSYQPLSRTEKRPDDQLLLDESLAAHRTANRKAVLGMLNAKTRFRQNKQGFRFSLKGGHIEWLLEVLNDIRVGSWIQLGSPASPANFLDILNHQTAPFFWALEVSGRFQMLFLGALQSEEKPGNTRKSAK